MASTTCSLPQGPGPILLPISYSFYLANGPLCRDIPGACEESYREEKDSAEYQEELPNSCRYSDTKSMAIQGSELPV